MHGLQFAVSQKNTANEEMHRLGVVDDRAWCNVVQLARWAEECEQDARTGREAGGRPLSLWKTDGGECDMAEGAGNEKATAEGRALAVRFQAQREARLWKEKEEKEEKAQAEEKAEEKARKKETARDTAPLRLGGRGAPPVARRVAICRSLDKVKGRVDAKKK